MQLPDDVTWTDLAVDALVLFATFFVALLVIGRVAAVVPALDPLGLSMLEAALFGAAVALLDLIVTVIRFAVPEHPGA